MTLVWNWTEDVISVIRFSVQTVFRIWQFPVKTEFAYCRLVKRDANTAYIASNDTSLPLNSFVWALQAGRRFRKSDFYQVASYVDQVHICISQHKSVMSTQTSTSTEYAVSVRRLLWYMTVEFPEQNGGNAQEHNDLENRPGHKSMCTSFCVVCPVHKNILRWAALPFRDSCIISKAIQCFGT